MKKISLKKIWIAVAWCLPFLVSGIAAPILFSQISEKQVAGHYAGSLFIFSALWLLLVSIRHKYPMSVRGFITSFFLLSLIFWTWRWQNNLPLNRTGLLYLSGSTWHHGLTGLYLCNLGVLFFHEYQR